MFDETTWASRGAHDAPRTELRPLYRALDDAARVLRLPDGAWQTGRALIGRIPRGAPEPISPAAVQDLAADRGVDPRTIRNHVKILEDYGLVVDATAGGGRRYVRRDRAGAIVTISGIDLSPLLDEADQWADRAATLSDKEVHRRGLCSDILLERHRIRVRLRDADVPENVRQLYDDLPRRIGHLSLNALLALEQSVTDLLWKLEPGRKLDADRPEEIDRPYITEKDRYLSCNPAMPAEKGRGAESGPGRSTCGLEHLDFEQVLRAAPQDWLQRIDLHGSRSLQGFIDVAYGRMKEMGIDEAVWGLSQRTLGPWGAAVIIMIADAKSIERGGPVRNPGATREGWPSAPKPEPPSCTGAFTGF